MNLRNIRICLATAMLVAGNVAAAAESAACTAWTNAHRLWETNMVRYGDQWGRSLNPASGVSFDEDLNNVYYDGQWVFQQIAAYRGEAEPWRTYAEYARKAYVDAYLIPNSWGAQGYRRFPHGLYNDMLAGGTTTRTHLELLRDRPQLSLLSTYSGDYRGDYQSLSRENAYALQANIIAEKAGSPRVIENGVSRPGQLVAWSSEHFRQWKVAEYSAADYSRGDDIAMYLPFMAGLSMHALIEWIEWETQNGRDPNASWPRTTWPSIEAMMRDFMKWMVTQSRITRGANLGAPMWVEDGPGSGYFMYADNGNQTSPAPLLGNLLAYQFQWMASRLKNGDASAQADARLFAATADKLFVRTINEDALGISGKFFNQVYRLSFLYHNERSRNLELSACGTGGTVAAPRPPSQLQVN